MEQLAATPSHRRLRDGCDAGRHGLTRRALPLAACFIVAGIFLFSLAPHAPAQSGRRTTASPSASPAPDKQRPRRATPRPADNIPGQPATPDAPGTETTPARTPDANAPRTQSNETKAPAPANASDDAAIEVDDGEIVRVTSNLVPVSATVTDTRGKAITDLTVDDFELRVDGQPKPIGGLSHAETPVRLVMLFDNSDSIRASREFEKQAAVRFFRNVLRPVDQAAVYSVGTVFDLVQPLTSDVDKLVRTIEHFDKPQGATSLLEAVAHAAEYLRLVPGRKVLVIVSDGADTVSDITFDETLRRVLAADCQVYSVQTGAFENANLVDLIALRRLETFADRTGGAVYTPKTNTELDVAFAQISSDLAQQYVLSYYPTDERNDNRFRVINLRVKTRPNLRVRARRGYYPRRPAGQQLSSSVSDNFAGEQMGRSEPPSDLNPPLTMPPALAVRAPRSTITFGGPAHGSKNMDADTSGDPLTRNEQDVRVKANPAPAIVEAKTEASAAPRDKAGSNLSARDNAAPRDKAAPPGLKPEPAGAKTDEAASPSPQQAEPDDDAPAPHPTPTPARTQANAPAQSPETNAPQSSRPEQTTKSSPSPQSTTERTPSSEAHDEPPPHSSPNAPKTPLSVGQLNSRAVSLPRPLYPPMGKQMRIEGTVKVAVVVDEQGRVVAARAESGHALLQNAAVQAARQARFAPTLVGGQPVAVAGFITYTFTL
ncbi:MAG TPA: VWA domain-containing protein [Pyrinomonadaceae bacterium]